MLPARPIDRPAGNTLNSEGVRGLEGKATALTERTFRASDRGKLTHLN